MHLAQFMKQVLFFFFPDSKILTSTPTSLLTQMRHLYQDQSDEKENGREVENILNKLEATKNTSSDRKLVEEIDPTNRSIVNQRSLDPKRLLQKDRQCPREKDRQSYKLDDSIFTGEGSLLGELKKMVPISDEEMVI